MSNNVFKQLYSPWRYPSNWPRNIRLFFRRYKWAYQRASRGYADCDLWDMSDWLLQLFTDSLNDFADNHMGYPGDEEFDTDEKWTEYLKEMAQLFYQAQESNQYYSTPIAEEWDKWITEHPIQFDENGKIVRPDFPKWKEFLKEDRENAKKRETDVFRGLMKMAHVWFSLWD